ncbi:unnamed protein product [Closterium sp. Yama58-4]|nr:unnamed protein product [Closterium sp. Yama58-4]
MSTLPRVHGSFFTAREASSLLKVDMRMHRFKLGFLSPVHTGPYMAVIMGMLKLTILSHPDHLQLTRLSAQTELVLIWFWM